jgi:hypothetical protein
MRFLILFCLSLLLLLNLCSREDFTGEWEDPFDCDCDEAEWNSEGICITLTVVDSFFTGTAVVMDTFLLETWVPSECYADCFGYVDYEIIDCEDITGTSSEWHDCDCEYSLNDEPVCVLTNPVTGEICPFPNMCFAECAGYSNDDVVDCEEHMDLECIDCMDEEIDPVCVVDEFGIIFPVPNACFADCLGLQIIDDADCGEFTRADGDGLDIELIDPASFQLGEDNSGIITQFRLNPNPAVDFITLDLTASKGANMRVSVLSTNGELLITQQLNLTIGVNKHQLDIDQLVPGMYIVQLIGESTMHSEKLIKQ